MKKDSLEILLVLVVIIVAIIVACIAPDLISRGLSVMGLWGWK